MLSIRMQRRGRKGHATYRVVVQDSRQSPDSGKFVALLGSYDPHTKTTTLTKDKAEFYLTHGAQPSDRVVKLFKSEGVKIPKWVKEPTKQERMTRNPEKLRKNRPAEAEPKPEEKSVDETAQVEESTETPEEPKAEKAEKEVSEKPAEESSDEASEKPAEPDASEEKEA